MKKGRLCRPFLKFLVPKRGLEPPQCCHRQDLNLVRLPIPPPGHIFKLDSNYIVPIKAVNGCVEKFRHKQEALRNPLDGCMRRRKNVRKNTLSPVILFSRQKNEKGQLKSWPFLNLVPKRGLEPPQCCHRQDLNLVRLPIPPPGQGVVCCSMCRAAKTEILTCM
jgi:hypothetical protein